MSPKQEFQAHAAFNRFASMLNSPDMDYAIRTATLPMIENLPEAAEGEANLAGYHQIIGMKKFIRALRSLAEIPAERKPNTIGQLKQL